ncbi:MAG: glycosyltransferase family 39 protein, partial [Candidatus Roizmanbacteria bacterium]|nr:glycosyltransferase family 39 protein [Candidatus Roizmanbacteria bacterium]
MKYIPLISIVVLAIFLRVWQLDRVPPAPSLDEVSIGWNAYSIAQTGADEYGTRLPLLLRAYDDWRPALYVYLVVPFIQLFGLTALAVRLPSVLLSVLSVIGTYFFAKKLLKDKNEYGALLAAVLVAISPWHMYISRLGHEANAGIAFLIFALVFFFRKSYLFASLFFSLSFMSYQSEKIVVPLVVVSLAFIYYRQLLNKQRKVVLAIILAIVITAPFLRESFKPDALIRFKGTNIFAANEQVFMDHAVKRKEAIEQNNPIGIIRHNRRIVSVEIVAQQYFSHFNPNWLFFNTGREAHKVPGTGILWIGEGLLIIFGLIALHKRYIPVRSGIVLLILILTAPLPASITTGAPHAMRSFTAIPAVQIFAGIGAVFISEIFGKLGNRGIVTKRASVVGLVLLPILLSVATLYNNYFVVFPKEQSDSFQYSLSRALTYVAQHEGEYDRVVFSNEHDLYQSYMFYLFNAQYDPETYQSEGGTISGG